MFLRGWKFVNVFLGTLAKSKTFFTSAWHGLGIIVNSGLEDIGIFLCSHQYRLPSAQAIVKSLKRKFIIKLFLKTGTFISYGYVMFGTS